MNNQNNENLNFKEAKKHNKQLLKKYRNDEITSEELDERRIDLLDLVENKLETDDGLDKFHFILFHILNKNGARNLLPNWKEFDFINDKGEKITWYGSMLVYSSLDNYHSNKLSEYLGKADRVTWRNIRSTVNGIREDAEKWQERRKTKEVA